MRAHMAMIYSQAADFWMARASVIGIVILQLLVINNLAVGPCSLAPAIELALLVPLSFATAWTQARVATATTDEHWHLIARLRRGIRALALFMTALITLMNTAALMSLLVNGEAKTAGKLLLLDAVNIWLTNTIVFALWFWSIDRGGPASRGLERSPKCDFLFTQMTVDKGYDGWSPGFVDYMFLAFTNATAFSPTDTLPLSRRAKILMMLESGIFLLTVALVTARAVNILK